MVFDACGWMQAIDAFALLHAEHVDAMLPVRGGREPYGGVIFSHARSLGLEIEDVAVA
jgi:hypothetical protein